MPGGAIADAYFAGKHAGGVPNVPILRDRVEQHMSMKRYGIEYILDLQGCDAKQFTRPAIAMFMRRICRIMNLTPEELHIWGYDDPAEKAAAPPHLKGVSAVQFITTSNVTIHALDDLGLVCLNIFTCGKWQHDDITNARRFAVDWFHAHSYTEQLLNRG